MRRGWRRRRGVEEEVERSLRELIAQKQKARA